MLLSLKSPIRAYSRTGHSQSCSITIWFSSAAELFCCPYAQLVGLLLIRSFSIGVLMVWLNSAVVKVVRLFKILCRNYEFIRSLLVWVPEKKILILMLLRSPPLSFCIFLSLSLILSDHLLILSVVCMVVVLPGFCWTHWAWACERKL